MWIRRRTGIAQRHLVGEGETTADLAQHAAKKALKNAGLSGGDIDLIIVATTTPDNTFPSTATKKLQHLIGAKRAIVLMYRLFVLDLFMPLILEAMIQSGRGRRALVWCRKVSQNCWIGKTGPLVSCLAMELVQWFWNFLKILRIGGSSHLSCTLMVLIVTFCMWMVAHPATLVGHVRMEGKEVFRHAVEKLAAVMDEALDAAQMDATQIDWLVPHQANIRIIDAAKKMGMASDRVVRTVKQHANTSAASILLALAVAVDDGRIKNGDVIAMEAIGGGLVWGAALVKFGKPS